MVDFTNLGDIYHLSMIIIGFCSLFLGVITLARLFRKDKQERMRQNRQYSKRKNKKRQR